MLNNSLLILLGTIPILLLCVLLHEFGHIYYYYTIRKRWLKPRYESKKILVGHAEDYLDLTELEYRRMIWSGLLLGSLPITVWVLMHTSPIEPGPVLGIFAYIIGCRPDLKKLELTNKVPLEESVEK